MTRLVPRPEWGPRLSIDDKLYKTGPDDELWLHHSVTRLTDDWRADMRAIEDVGEDRFGRFSYSYAYHARSRLWLEGAGHSIGAHTGGRNTRATGCVIIGNADELEVGDSFVEDFVWLVDELGRLGRLVPPGRSHLFERGRWTTPSYPTGGHRDQKATACPGAHAYALVPRLRAAVLAGPNPGDLTMADITAITDRLDGIEAKVDDLHSQWIGRQTEAKPETLRDLLRVSTRRSAEITTKVRRIFERR